MTDPETEMRRAEVARYVSAVTERDELRDRLAAAEADRNSITEAWLEVKRTLTAAEAERDAWRHQCDGANRLYNEAVAQRDAAVELLRGFVDKDEQHHKNEWDDTCPVCGSTEWPCTNERARAFLARLRDRST